MTDSLTFIDRLASEGLDFFRESALDENEMRQVHAFALMNIANELRTANSLKVLEALGMFQTRPDLITPILKNLLGDETGNVPE